MTESDSSPEGTNHQKGQRNENEAKRILKRVYGAGVEKVDCFTNHDPFGYVDLIAMQPGEPIKFVQVKTNRFTADARQKYSGHLTRHLPPEHAELEVWVRVDREGWRLHERDSSGFSKYMELPCDEKKAGELYRERCNI